MRAETKLLSYLVESFINYFDRIKQRTRLKLKLYSLECREENLVIEIYCRGDDNLLFEHNRIMKQIEEVKKELKCQ